MRRGITLTNWCESGMDRLAVEELENVLDAQIGFYLRADRLVRMLTADNVADVMARLPASFRQEFVTFAHEVYAPRGERVAVAGRRLPESSIEALRGWLSAQDVRGAARLPVPGIAAVERPAEHVSEAVDLLAEEDLSDVPQQSDSVSLPTSFENPASLVAA